MRLISFLILSIFCSISFAQYAHIETLSGKRVNAVKLDMKDGKLSFVDNEGKAATIPLSSVLRIDFDGSEFIKLAAANDALTSQVALLRSDLSNTSAALEMRNASLNGVLERWQDRAHETVDATPFKGKGLVRREPVTRSPARSANLYYDESYSNFNGAGSGYYGRIMPDLDLTREVDVSGYYRKDGTYVRSHTRSRPGNGHSRRR